MLSNRFALSACALLFAGQPALAFDPSDLLDWDRLFAKELPYDYYAGLGVSHVHHTGYVPNSYFAVEDWAPGVKAFAGKVLVDRARIEAGYYYLGKSPFPGGPLFSSSEQSHAVGGALLLYTSPLSKWRIPTLLPTRLFARLGGAYKWIDHRSASGDFAESGVSYVIGGGLESDITPAHFLRLEYEYLSKIISGTTSAIDVQHTAISLSFGANSELCDRSKVANPAIWR